MLNEAGLPISGIPVPEADPIKYTKIFVDEYELQNDN